MDGNVGWEDSRLAKKRYVTVDLFHWRHTKDAVKHYHTRVII